MNWGGGHNSAHNSHKLGSLKQQKFIESQSGGQKSKFEVSAGLLPSGVILQGRICFLAFSSFQRHLISWLVGPPSIFKAKEFSKVVAQDMLPFNYGHSGGCVMVSHCGVFLIVVKYT